MELARRSRFARTGATAAIALGLTLAGCGVTDTVGDGPVQKESRPVDTFTRVVISSGIHLTVTIGPAGELEVRAPANILPIITTEVEAGTLTIASSKSFIVAQPVEVAVATPSIEAVTQSGGSAVALEGLDGERLAIDLSGGSHVGAGGTVKDLTLTASGGSRADLGDLATATAALDVSGGSNVTVLASEHVGGSASGGSHVTVLGQATTDIAATGGAEVSSG